MELEIIKDGKNHVLNRREIAFYILQDDKTPSREEAKRELCKKFNLSPDSTIVVNMSQSFGARQCKAMAHSYENPESMKRFEHAYMFERKTKKEKRDAKGAAPAKEAKKEEKK